MNNTNNKVSTEENLSNLYSNLYKKRIEKISLDIKTNNLLKEEKNLNFRKSKLVQNKIYILLLRLLSGLIICLLLIGYISVSINKIPLLITIPKVIHIISTTIGVLFVSTLGAYLTAKIENNFKSKNKEKQNKLSKETEKISKEINLNKENLNKMTTEINNILKEITRLEKQKENNINKYNDTQEIEEFKEKAYIRKRML